MNKSVAVLVAIVVAAALCAWLFLRRESPLAAAESAEARGDYRSARAQYVEALLEMTKTAKLVDCNRARALPPQAWYQEVEKYVAWVTAPAASPSAAVSNIMEGLARCTTHVKSDIFFTDDSVFYHTEQTFGADWKRAFFPRNATIPGNHSALISRAVKDGLSILRIVSLSSYTYQGTLLDLSSWQRTDFGLYPESEVSLLVRPGKHMLICSSEVAFQGNVSFENSKVWHSPKNVLTIEVPNRSSLKKVVLKTFVARSGPPQ